jgi:hypothetical protein
MWDQIPSEKIWYDPRRIIVLGIVRFLIFESYKISAAIFQSESEKIFKKMNS